MNKPESVSAPRILTRDFVIGFLTYFAFQVACFALIPTLPLYLAELGTRTGEIGILVGVYSAASLVSRLLAGTAIARYSEKKVMVVSILLFAVTFIACILFRPFWPFFVVRLVQGLAYACLDTAVFALVVKITPAVYRGRALGYFLLAPGLATVVAPSFGVFLAHRFGFVFLFLLCMGLCLCALAFSAILRPQENAASKGMVSSSTTSFFEPRIIVPSISAFLYNFVLGSIMAFFALYAIRRGMNNPGYFFSAAAIMTITGRSLGARIQDTWSKEKIILVSTFAAMVAMVLLAFSRSQVMFISIGLIWGTVVAFFFPVSMAYALDYAGSSDGTSVGTFRAFMDLGTASGPMVMGMVITFTGYPTMFLCLAGICFINLCYFQFYVRKKRNAALRLRGSGPV
jgi:predicted MFS family arabinose efflux permease